MRSLSIHHRSSVMVPTHQVVYKARSAPSAFFPDRHFTELTPMRSGNAFSPVLHSSLRTFLLLPLRSLADVTPLLPVVILHLVNSLSPFSRPDP